jgi:hypothetical protein
VDVLPAGGYFLEGEFMKTKSLIAALALAAGSVGIAGVAYARVVDIEIGVAPPPARVEVVPAPREGYVYEKGHYETADGQTYVWVEGRYFPNREGHIWHPYVMERSGEQALPCRLLG